jgi:hypothetical protein
MVGKKWLEMITARESRRPSSRDWIQGGQANKFTVDHPSRQLFDGEK